MKNAPKKILKFLLGICIFFIALCIGSTVKGDSSLNNTHNELVTTINNSKEDLEKQLSNLNDSLNKTKESIKQLENSTNN
ncbi:hypothetical protein ACRTAK_001597 [Clostridium perfringens]